MDIGEALSRLFYGYTRQIVILFYGYTRQIVILFYGSVQAVSGVIGSDTIKYST